ncbi:MAG: regulator SirB [Nitrosomonas sp.]|nr:MAG: regulator SirB [Nitrosomonas sp.]
MSYALLKMIHVGSVIVSYMLFFLRGVWYVQNSENLHLRWVKILPHVVDTVLLVSAITLAFIIQQDPLTHSWLTAKVIGLMVYIGLGMIAMRFGKTRRMKIMAWLAAQCVFIYIVLVAVTKNPALGIL